MAAHNWRSLRQRALGEGITDLMALPSMHVVLDFTESLGMESAMSKCKTEGEAASALSDFHDRLYRPDLTEARMINEPLPVPQGFEDDEVEAAFDAFAASIGGR